MGIQIFKAYLHFSFGMKGGERETIDVSLHVGVPIKKAWELLANHSGTGESETGGLRQSCITLRKRC
jgi:hypothetical protein